MSTPPQQDVEKQPRSEDQADVVEWNTGDSGTATPANTLTSARSFSKGTVSGGDESPNWPKEWRAYSCLFGCFLLMFNSWGIVNTYGTFASYYKQHLLPGHDQLLLNLVGSTESFVVLALSFVVGRILDAGHTRPLLACGAFLVTLGMFLLSVVNDAATYAQGNYGLIWLTQGFIVGLGMSCFFVSSSQIAATYFVKRKAVAIGIVASGASIAGLIYPLMTKFLITETGFNNAVRYVATLIGTTSILAFFLAVPNPKHTFRKPGSWARVDVWIDSNAFRSPAWCWFTAGVCFVFFGFYAVFFSIEDWAAYNRIAQKDGSAPPGLNIALPNEVPDDAIRTFWLLSIMNASSTTGRILAACFAERLGTLNIHAATTLVGSLLLLILWTLASDLSAAVAFVVVFGAFSGAIIGLPPASVAEILGRGDVSMQSRLGQWTGMMYSIASIFALTGPVIAGHFVTEYGGEDSSNYLSVQLWSGICLLLAAFCMLVARYYARDRDSKSIFSRIRRRPTEARG